MALFVHDTFTGTAGTNLQSHTGETGATWTKHPSYPTQNAVLSDAGRLRSGTANNTWAVYYAIGVPPSADYDVEADFLRKDLSAEDETGIWGRLSTTAETGYLLTFIDGNWQLWRVVAGVYTAIGSNWPDTLPVDTTRTAMLRMRGTTIQGIIAGTIRISVTDSAVTAAGRAGVYFYDITTNSTGIHLDNFHAQHVLVASAAPVLPSVDTTSASKLTVKGAGLGALPSVKVSGLGVTTDDELTPAVSTPFRVLLREAISAPFFVSAVEAGQGPLVGPSLAATGALLIKGAAAGVIGGLALEAAGEGPGAVGELNLPGLNLAGTGIVHRSEFIEIGGVAHRIYENPPLEIDDWIEERSTCRFVVRDDAGEYSFRAHQPVSVYDHIGERIFGGYIDTVSERRINQFGAKRHAISCIDNHYKADKRKAAASYENTAIHTIVADLVTDYLEDEDVMLADALIDTGPVVGEAVFNYQPVSLCIQTMAERVNYWWRIDHDAVLHFRERGTETAPWTLTGADIIGDPDYNRSGPMYRNRQYVRGVKDVTDVQTFTRVGDGVTREWTLPFPLAKVPTVEVNSVAQSVGIKGLDPLFSDDPVNGKKFFWSKGDPVVTQDRGATVLSGAQTLDIDFQGEFNLIVSSEDTAAILERQAIEGGGSGIVESVDDDASLNSRSAGMEKAAGLLNKYGIDGEQLSFETIRAGLAPGMVLTVNLPAHDLDNDDLLIEHINTQRIRTAEGFMYRRRVEAILGPSIGSWAKFFLRITKVPSFIDRLSVGEEGALAILHTESEDLEIEEDVVFSANACSFPATDLYPSSTLFPC